MSIKLFLLIPFYLISLSGWYNNLDEAEKIARKEHKFILLNFSGSDWCGPCMRMRKEIFESKTFREMVASDLVLVNVDFPRKKKNQLSAEQQKINFEMADKYNTKGIFPYTLLLDSDGKVIKSWEGFPEETPYAFSMEVLNCSLKNK